MSDECAFGQLTGRVLIYDDQSCEVIFDLSARPSHDDWHEWTEYRNSEGEATWVSSDPDGYWLDDEEFWGGEEQDFWNQWVLRVVESPTSMMYVTWDGPGSEPVYYGTMKQAVRSVGMRPIKIIKLDDWKRMSNASIHTA